MRFTWDENKRTANLKKHALDFIRAGNLFDGRFTHTYPSTKSGEERFVTIGIIDGVFIAVVWTQREDDIVRIISMRRARHAEKRAYGNSLV